ncbi:unnamed protein product [Zymoseptoria tritici ST99CH_1A5]|uniref:Rhodopsin domain-containing protein n=1 Tax=Zymoseptoria tritici ST99CH_1A5 TaxID=1276529 RepID=A0A1Y6L2X2_ZYMTR|nr:unnamed protein product [Zymoseptoria tritici ST99CH_1A5]
MDTTLFPRQDSSLAPLPPLDPAYCAENNNGQILGVTGAVLGMAVFAVVLRMFVRITMVRKVGADDYVILLSLLLAVGTMICFAAESFTLGGRHIMCMSQHDFYIFAKWQFYHSIWVMAGVVLVKVSIALFLMRLVPPKRSWKAFLWGSIVFLICFMLVCALTLVFQCTPISAAWDYKLKKQPGTRCFNTKAFIDLGLFNSIVNCVTDAMFATLPVPIILGLQVNTRTKITLAGILGLGYTACAAGIVKAITQYTFFSKKDPFWHNAFSVWNMIELCVGITAASLPALKPLIVRWLSATKALVDKNSKHHRRVQSDQYGHVSDLQNARRHAEAIRLEDRKITVHHEIVQVQDVVDTSSDVSANGRKKSAAYTEFSAKTGASLSPHAMTYDDHAFPRTQSEERLTEPKIHV